MPTRTISQIIRNAVSRPTTYASIPFRDSTSYWQQRYELGFRSGAGSRHRLAAFKAEFLNAFVRVHRVQTVLELGSGDGAQLALAEYPAYRGFDVSPVALEHCRARFAHDSTKQFHRYDPATFRPHVERCDLALSLDVIYHLVEPETYALHLEHLFDAARRFVIIYSSDRDEATPDPHVRHHCFSRWVEAHRPDWIPDRVVPNPFPWQPDDPGTTWSDFHVYTRTPEAST